MAQTNREKSGDESGHESAVPDPPPSPPAEFLSAAPIVVFGAPRSGTTYLNRLLNEHPEVLITKEARLFVWLNQTVNVLPKNSRYLRNERERFIKHLHATMPGLIREFYRGLRDDTKPTARYWGDKNPHYAAPGNRGSLKVVATLFPESRFIHIVRDGRDVVTSLLRKGWAGFKDAHRIYTKHVGVGHTFGNRVGSERFFELRYEDLVADDEQMAGRIFEFLGIPMSPAVTEFCRSQARQRTPLQQPTRDLSSGAESSDWSRLLAPDQQVRSLELLRDSLIGYGYETESSIAELKAGLKEQASAAPGDPFRRRLAETIPEKATVLVATGGDDRLLLAVDGARAWHFPQVDRRGPNIWKEPPETSEQAVADLEQLRSRGAEYLVFPASQSWWREKYEAFHRHLESRHRLLLDDPDCLVYELKGSSEAVNGEMGDEDV